MPVPSPPRWPGVGANRASSASSAYLSGCAGRELDIDPLVYQSESETGHRNRAIGWMLRNFDIIEEDPTEILEAYFQQCAIRVTCRDLAIMGATLANHGVNPLTGQRAIAPRIRRQHPVGHVLLRHVRLLGEWIYNVGLPAKSGVGGGILAVLPGQLGIGVFSPPLDAQGNSARGIAVCRELSSRYNLHVFNSATPSLSVLRNRITGAQVASNRSRPEDEARLLRQHGDRIRLFEIQGNVTFGPAERVVRELLAGADTAFAYILDFSRVPQIDVVSSRLFLDTFEALAAQGIWVHITRSHHVSILKRSARRRHGDAPPARLAWENDADTALEFCENRLLESLGDRRSSSTAVAFEQCELVENLSAADREKVARLLTPRHFDKGSVVFEAGAPAAEMLIILKGKASISLTLANGLGYRVTTCTPGMTFGEMALLDGAPRSATVRADTDIEALSLGADGLDLLMKAEPVIHAKLLTNIARHLAARLRKRNAEVINSHL
jgi:glutaminase